MFDYVTVDLCVAYNFNKIMALDSIRAIELFRGNILAMWGDFTSQNNEIHKLLTYYNRYRMPLYIMFFLILQCFG